MRIRTATVGAVGAVLLGALAACGGSPETPDDGTGVLGTGTRTGEATATTATSAPAPAALSCEDLRAAVVGAVAFPLADYGGGLVQLSDGHFADSGGTTIDLLDACGTGDINGDGVLDAVAAVRIDPDGTGTFYTLVAWLGTDAGTPALAGSEALGDRNPVDSISIGGGVVTVVYFTRTAEVPLAGLNVRRTATYQFTEPGLAESGHTDESCGPCNP